MEKVCVVAEGGINSNGSIEVCKKLIDAAKFAGADIFKLQKRDINLVYSKEYLDSPRKSQWGETQRDQKEGLEFNKEEYDIIIDYCKKVDIEFMASPWDMNSLEFLNQYKSIKHQKVASAMLTHKVLLESMARNRKHTFLSTGMSSMTEIEEAVNIFETLSCPYTLLHCNSAYPMKPQDANLNMIHTLKNKFGNNNFYRGVGYSGHEVGLGISIAAVAIGATTIERHITLDRSMEGTDQSSSVEPFGFYRLVNHIREIEKAMGDGVKRITETEEKCRAKLRRV